MIIRGHARNKCEEQETQNKKGGWGGVLKMSGEEQKEELDVRVVDEKGETVIREGK